MHHNTSSTSSSRQQHHGHHAATDKLDIRNGTQGPYVPGLTELEVDDLDTISKLMSFGNAQVRLSLSLPLPPLCLPSTVVCPQLSALN